MTLSRSQLEQIRADAGADAVPIDFAKMASWSEVEAAAFFESGGDDHGPPPALQMVMDDLAMRFVVNCPAEEQVKRARSHGLWVACQRDALMRARTGVV